MLRSRSSQQEPEARGRKTLVQQDSSQQGMQANIHAVHRHSAQKLLDHVRSAQWLRYPAQARKWGQEPPNAAQLVTAQQKRPKQYNTLARQNNLD